VVVLSACVQMPSLPAIAAAESALGIPVTSTAVCTAWKMLTLLGVEPRVENAGALLSGIRSGERALA
jgi:maleate isomerase